MKTPKPKSKLSTLASSVMQFFGGGFTVTAGDVVFNGEGSVTLNNDGSLNLNGTATSDPHINGRIWVDGNAGNVVKISQG